MRARPRVELDAACHAQHRSFEAIGHRIVAAGVEDHDAHAAGALKRDTDLLVRHHVAAQVDLVLKGAVDGHQEVIALILQGVPGVEEQRHVGAAGLVAEPLERRVHVARAGVERQRDVEPKIYQGFGDVFGVGPGIGEHKRRVFVGGVPDHQCDTATGKSQFSPESDPKRAQDDQNHDARQRKHPPSLQKALRRQRTAARRQLQVRYCLKDIVFS